MKTAAAAGLGAVAAGLPGCAAGGWRDARRAPFVAPRRQKLRVAFIGVGGIGGHHLEETDELGIECPCFCDVDLKRMGNGVKRYPKAKRYQDYREMFDREHKNFDAVMIGIPDHQHYPATIIAMQLGKHVYTQKPLTHTVWEARQLALAAKRYGVVTQMGNQGHAGIGWRRVVEWIQGGYIGDVLEAHTWTDRPIWPQGMHRAEGEDPVPEHLNWEAWIGPAPMRPFKDADPLYDEKHQRRRGPYHWFNWRGWWDFGAGALGDMACHTMDGVFWALEPGHPTSIEPCAATPITPEAFPTASMIKWAFPRKHRRRAFTCYWYDGGLKPPRPPELEPTRRMPGTGNLFIGTKATILVSGDYGNSPRIIPETKMKEIGIAPEFLERSPGHVREWVSACKGEQPIDYPKSNFGYAGPFSEAVLLGNVALRVGRRIDWDGDHLRVTNLDEANQYISTAYREGWRVGTELSEADVA